MSFGKSKLGYENFITRLESKKIYPFLYIIPVFIFLLIYFYYPLFFSLGISLFKWSAIVPLDQAEFIGFNNYIELFKDPIFWISFKNTIIFVTGGIIIQNLFGFALALVLYFFKIKGSKLWRSIIFFPAILSPIIVGLIFRLIVAKEGLLNQILGGIGLGFLQKIWLGNTITPIFVITLVSAWQWTGYNMVIYYAGLQAMPRDLLEAATIDGCNWYQSIFKVIIPLLSFTITIAMVLNIIGGFKVFDIIYVMTGGGPAHYSDALTTYMFFVSFASKGSSQMGYASAIAIVITFVIFILALLRIRFTKNVEY